VPPAVEKIYTAMLAKVGTAASVHFVATSVGTQPGQPSTHLRYVADTGVSDGSQVATWSGSDQTGSFTIVAIGSTTYMKADANSLVTFFNAMPAETASKYAGKWLSFTSSDKLYASLRNDITLASVAASLEFLPAGVKTTSSTIVMTGKPIPSTSTPAGERATATTTISSHTKLPLSQSFSASYKGATEKSSILFSQWGAATIPSAPRGAIAYDSITVTTPTT
jgi:hypothetical protein